jgi:hypothetical protein
MVTLNVAFSIKTQETSHFGARNAAKILHFRIADYEAAEGGLKRNVAEMFNDVRRKQDRENTHIEKRFSIANRVRLFGNVSF